MLWAIQFLNWCWANLVIKIVLIMEQNICDIILISTLTFQQIYQKFMQPEKVVEKPNNPDQVEKKDRKKNEDKKIKHERPAQFERNADLITVDTVLDPLPKKNQILARPNLKDYQERQAKNKQRINKLFDKKKQVYNEKFKPNKPLQKGEGGKHDDFNQQVEEFKDLKERFNDVKNRRNAKRDQLTKLIQQAKQNNASIKKFKEDSKNSKEYYEEQIEKFEHRLITSQLSKEEQKNLNNEIMVLKRKVKDAEQVGNIQVRIDKAEQRKQELDSQIEKAKAEKQPLEQQFKQLKQQMDSKNEAIDKLKGELKNEKQQKTQAKQRNDKEYQEWKQNKKKRLNDFSDKVKAIDEQNKTIWKEYHQKNEAYWEQKHKLDFLEWQHKVKQRKVRDIEREKRKAFAIEKQKTREKQEQLKKYIKQIETCTFLTSYLKDILAATNKQQKAQQQKAEQPKDINAKIGEDAQWKKQKGLIVLQSKKTKEDEEPVKKGGKKNKKKNDKAEQSAVAKKFQVPFNIEVLFDTLKLLPPSSLEEVERKIEQLKERQALFERACSEEVNEADKQQIQKIKGSDKKERKEKVTEQKKNEDDFPTL